MRQTQPRKSVVILSIATTQELDFFDKIGKYGTTVPKRDTALALRQAHENENGMRQGKVA
jgi:hypothetical protein